MIKITQEEKKPFVLSPEFYAKCKRAGLLPFNRLEPGGPRVMITTDMPEDDRDPIKW